MLRKIRNLFITGLLVLLPLVLTAYLFWNLFLILDNWSRPMFKHWLGVDLPGIGFVFTLLLIFLTGIFATNIIGKKIIDIGEYLLLKIPPSYPGPCSLFDSSNSQLISGIQGS